MTTRAGMYFMVVAAFGAILAVAAAGAGQEDAAQKPAAEGNAQRPAAEGNGAEKAKADSPRPDLAAEADRWRSREVTYTEKPVRPDLRLTYIPPGRFIRGSGGRQNLRQAIEVTRGYYMTIYPLTERQFHVIRFWSENGMWNRPESVNHVLDLTWTDVKGAAEVLSARTDIDFRLPTCAEWENAWHANTRTDYFWGDDPQDGAPYYFDGPKRLFHLRTQNWADDVGQLKPNPWGLYDLGRGGEWCLDWYGSWYHKCSDGIKVLRDPKGPAYGEQWRETKHRKFFGGMMDRRGQRIREQRTLNAAYGGPAPKARSETGGIGFGRLVADVPLVPQGDYVCVVRAGEPVRKVIDGEPVYVSRARAMGGSTYLGPGGFPVKVIVVDAPRGVDAPDIPEMPDPPAPGQMLQLAIPNNPWMMPAPKEFRDKAEKLSSVAGWEGGFPRIDATRDPNIPYPYEGLMKVFEAAGEDDYLKVHYSRAGKAEVLCVIDVEPYTPRPGEEQPDVYFFVKTAEQQHHGIDTVSVVARRFEYEHTFMIQPKAHGGKVGPDPVLLNAIKALSPGDAVKITTAGKFIRSVEKYTPPATQPAGE